MPTTTARSDTPLFWNRTPFQTYLLDAISILVPTGEQFLIEAVEAVAVNLEGNPELRGEVERFVGEEKSHQTAHRLYNQRLDDQGYSIARFEQRIQADLSSYQQRLPLHERLCIAGAIEHVTSIVSKAVLGSRHWLCPQDQSRQARLWRWHSAEEIAHKHVTMDLMAACRIPYWQRVAVYLFVSAVMLGDMARHIAHFYRVDRQRTRVTAAAFWQSLALFSVRACVSLAKIGVDWLAYFLPLSPSKGQHERMEEARERDR